MLAFSARSDVNNPEYLPLETYRLAADCAVREGDGSADSPFLHEVAVRNEGVESWSGVIRMDLSFEACSPRFFMPGFLYGTNRGDAPLYTASKAPRLRKGGDDFWVKAETLLYIALIGYIHYELPPEEQNFATLIDMLNKMDAREDDEDYQNEVDLKFADLGKRKPGHFAVRQYAKYKMAAGKTAKSILVSCGARLAVFDIEELREITAYDELHLDTIGEKRTALFLIMSDTDASFNFLISMAYSQMFNLLCERADDVHGGRLPVHVRCLIDEFANIGQIPNFEKLIATIRSREISACIVLQAQSQLKAIYKDNADTIVGNCDTLLFLGGKEKTTLKEMEELLGKETIDTFNTGESRGRETSHSLNYQKLGKSLMSVDEIAVMDGGKCILQVRGVRPFLSDKYDITSHPNYKYLSDSDPKNAFHIEKYLSRQLRLRLEEESQVWEIDVSDTPGEEEELLEELTDETQLLAAGYGGLL